MNPLLIGLERLLKSLGDKAIDWRDIIKMGRTQLQDALPMTFGQEFGAFSNSIRKDKDNLIKIQETLLELNMGGTAIGTGFLTHKDYPLVYLKHMQEISGLPVRVADDLIEASWITLSCSCPDSAAIVVIKSLLITRNDIWFINSGITGFTFPGIIEDPGCN
jgi:aspartate ammonia-lyase